ncbi:Tm-1-like ATP-binding domain-containing protein, partial [Patulibacter sp. S7RM1-6]
MSPTVALLGTLDTKEVEYAYLRDRLRAQGTDVVLIDVGVRAPRDLAPDVPRTEVAAAGGADSAALE